MKKKTNYNPFKMWGSYVLGILGFLSGSFLFGLSQGYSSSNNYSLIIIPTIFGFLIGWGIHSLLRYLKNKR